MSSFCLVCADHPADYDEDRSVSLTNPKHVLPQRSPQRKKQPSVSSNAASHVARLEDQVRRMQSQLDAFCERGGPGEGLKAASAAPSPFPLATQSRASLTTTSVPVAADSTRGASAMRPNAQENAFVSQLRKDDSFGRESDRKPSPGQRSGSSSGSRAESQSFATHLGNFPTSDSLRQQSSRRPISPVPTRSPLPMRHRGATKSNVCAACGNDLRMLSSYVEMLRTGFFDLCAAVQADLQTLRREQDLKAQDLQTSLMYNVNSAVRKEHLYHQLLEERGSEAAARNATTMPIAAAVQAPSNYVSVQEHNEVLLELRRMQVVVSELQKGQFELQRQLASSISTATTTTTTSSTQSSVAQQVLLATEPRLDAMVRQQIAPLAEHVRALTSTHQSLIQTVVDERCKTWEESLRLHSSKVDAQVTDLRSRLLSQSAEWRTAIQAVCASLQVAVPPL